MKIVMYCHSLMPTRGSRPYRIPKSFKITLAAELHNLYYALASCRPGST